MRRTQQKPLQRMQPFPPTRSEEEPRCHQSDRLRVLFESYRTLAPGSTTASPSSPLDNSHRRRGVGKDEALSPGGTREPSRCVGPAEAAAAKLHLDRGEPSSGTGTLLPLQEGGLLGVANPSGTHVHLGGSISNATGLSYATATNSSVSVRSGSPRRNGFPPTARYQQQCQAAPQEVQRNPTTEATSSPPSVPRPEEERGQAPAKTAPPAISPQQRSWAAALVRIALEVWAPLGLLSRPLYGVCSYQMEGVHRESMADRRALVDLLHAYYTRDYRQRPRDEVVSEAGASSNTSADSSSKLFFQAMPPTPPSQQTQVRHGLWLILYNAVFYCLSALDRESRRQVESLKGLNRTMDDHTEVEATPSDEENHEGGLRLPAALAWRYPSDPPSDDRGTDSRAVGGSREMYGGLLHTPLPIQSWHFMRRCLAVMGYRRDAFYLQSPTSGNCHELLLALLWLTKRYKLIAVSEYIALHATSPHLLQYRAEKEGKPTKGKASSSMTADQRLLESVGMSLPWPPVSFAETAVINHRLAQIDSIMGPSCKETDNPTAATGTILTRRVMALRRLLALSFQRLQHALHQRVTQHCTLGLHSAWGAQLSLPTHDAAFAQMITALESVSGLDSRVREKLNQLYACGQLVADALRRDADCDAIAALDLDKVLKEDEGTWLGTYLEEDLGFSRLCGELPTARRCQGLNLKQTLSAFGASQTRQRLLETWRSLRRHATLQGAGRSGMSSGACPCVEDGERPRAEVLVVDREAQAQYVRNVIAHAKSRYMLHANLAAEHRLLCQKQKQGTLSCVRVSAQRTLPTHSMAPPAAPNAATVAPFALTISTECPSPNGDIMTGSSRMQLTEVGLPSQGATTSAILEGVRLTSVLKDLTEGATFYISDAQRVQHCKEALDNLYEHYGLRVARTISKAATA